MKKDSTSIGVKELAKLANVSIGTIDRVLHDRPGVALKTKERVLAVLATHNYQPNLIARSLANRKTTRVVAIIPKESLESAYWKFPLQGIEQAALEIQPYNFLVDVQFFDQNDRQSFIDLTNELLRSDFDAVVVAPMFHAESQLLFEHCDKNEIPYVFLNSDIPDVKSVAYFGPDLFQSGCMAGQLMRYLLGTYDEILLVHISKEMETQHHLLRKEEGLLHYMDMYGMGQKLHKLMIRDTDYQTIEAEMEKVLSNQAIRLVFVTNSRVASVARYIEERRLNDLCLIGFDYLPDNITYLEKGVVDFLVCHKPIAQGYKSIMSLFRLLESKIVPEKINYMPIDIISKENYRYYEN